MGRSWAALFALQATALCAALATPASAGRRTLQSRPPAFRHGVASGEPTATSIILWTRVTPEQPGASVPVEWEVSRSPGFEQLEAWGQAEASASRDFTVKVEVPQLLPQADYHYRFTVGGAASPVGRFRLPPPLGQPLEQLRYAIFSCSSWGWGFFNAYQDAAQRALDFWVHLGDFIYEYSNQEFPAPEEAARLGEQPANEVVTLQDYRTRYAFYREDASLQELFAAAPLIAMMDDHEVANNAYRDGAQGHNATADGSWEARKRAALQAYHEWMPTREFGSQPSPNNWRAFQFGNLATLLMLESRLAARTQQGLDEFQTLYSIGSTGAALLPPEQWSALPQLNASLAAFKAESEANRTRPEAQLLGPVQLEWVRSATQASLEGNTTWQLYGSGTVMQDTFPPDVEAAISQQPDPQLKQQWAQALQNLTDGGQGMSTTYAKSGAGRGVWTTVTGYMKLAVRSIIALARARIAYNSDSWMGYQAEKRRFLEAIAEGAAAAGASLEDLNAVVYGGDSHNAWVGMNKLGNETIATEFDGPSVTSPGIDGFFPFVPTDLVAAGFLASNADTMTYANTQDRGFMLVDLTHDRQRLQMVYVDTVASPKFIAACGAAFEVWAGQKAIARVPCP